MLSSRQVRLRFPKSGALQVSTVRLVGLARQIPLENPVDQLNLSTVAHFRGSIEDERDVLIVHLLAGCGLRISASYRGHDGGRATKALAYRRAPERLRCFLLPHSAHPKLAI
jgi:hypothetical protein